jgi:hypothetical protein
MRQRTTMDLRPWALLVLVACGGVEGGAAQDRDDANPDAGPDAAPDAAPQDDSGGPEPDAGDPSDGGPPPVYPEPVPRTRDVPGQGDPPTPPDPIPVESNEDWPLPEGEDFEEPCCPVRFVLPHEDGAAAAWLTGELAIMGGIGAPMDLVDDTRWEVELCMPLGYAGSYHYWMDFDLGEDVEPLRLRRLNRAAPLDVSSPLDLAHAFSSEGMESCDELVDAGHDVLPDESTPELPVIEPPPLPEGEGSGDEGDGSGDEGG